MAKGINTPAAAEIEQFSERASRLVASIQRGFDRKRPALTASLIHLAAAGHGVSVKRLMKDAGLVGTMEPLWHAVRADLREELEPLPAEIMDVVTDVRQRFAEERRRMKEVMLRTV